MSFHKYGNVFFTGTGEKCRGRGGTGMEGEGRRVGGRAVICVVNAQAATNIA